MLELAIGGIQGEALMAKSLRPALNRVNIYRPGLWIVAASMVAWLSILGIFVMVRSAIH